MIKKTTWGLAASLFLALAPLAKAQSEGMPLLMQDHDPALKAIGRIGNGIFTNKQGCTGVLIAPDLVLTAAHCVSENGGGGQIFVAGWSDSGEVARATVIRSIRHPFYAPDGKHKPTADIGLAILATPLEHPAPLLLSMDGHKKIGEDVAILGYHGGAPEGLSGRFDCRLTQALPGVFKLPCPVRSGNSGAPVLLQGPEGWMVIATVSSRYGQTHALAVPPGPWLREKIWAHSRR